MTAITVYIDFKSPQAYLALKPTLQLAEGRDLDIDWLPYRTKQAVILPRHADETRGESHVRVRQQQRHQTCLKYAEIQGIPMRFPDMPGNTDCALAALLWARAAPMPFIEAAYAAYWSEGSNLDDPAVVSGLLAAAGYSADSFEPAPSIEVLEENQLSAEELGVFDTPMYLVDEQLFLGREQLPWIKTLLG